MNSLQVLINRIKKDYMYQFRIWKNVLDWTVMLYILIPAIVAAVIIYRSWWLELPSWSNLLSVSVIASAFYIGAWSGVYRLFVKEADGIFYLKHTSDFISMKKWAFTYEILKTILRIVLLMFVFLPFLHNMDLFEIVCFLFYLIAMSFFIQSLHLKIRFSYNGWKQKIWHTTLFIVFFFGNLSLFILEGSTMLLIMIAILLAFVSFYLVQPIVCTTRFFQDECLLENEQRLRFVTVIFGLSPSIEKPKIIKRKKPFILRHKLFKQRNAQKGFIELFCKIFLRNFLYVGGYFRLIAVTSAAIFILPLVLKLVIGFGFCFFIISWIEGVWDKIIAANPISKRYSDHQAFYQARQKTVWFFTILSGGILLISFVLSKVVL